MPSRSNLPLQRKVALKVQAWAVLAPVVVRLISAPGLYQVAQEKATGGIQKSELSEARNLAFRMVGCWRGRDRKYVGGCGRERRKQLPSLALPWGSISCF